MYQSYKDRSLASQFAAMRIARALNEDLEKQETTTLIVCGGRTPIPCFETLSQEPLPWSRVTIMLTDERVVDATHEDSNERMVRSSLMHGNAAKARFHRLEEGPLPAEFSPACALVGMGEDGHFASLFPDLEQLALLSSTNAAPAVARVNTSASPYARLTLNLAGLLRARTVLLLAFGDGKRDVLREPGARPVAALINQSRTPTEIIWAP